MRLPFDHFDLIARYYDRLIRPRADDPLPGLLAAQPGHLVLDVGGGTGRISHALNGSGARVIVCDYAPGMARQAQAKGLTAAIGSVVALPFADGVADRVLVVDAFHHFVAPMPQVAYLRNKAGAAPTPPASGVGARPASLGLLRRPQAAAMGRGATWGALPAQLQAAAELIRVLKPGGRLIVEEPDIRQPAVKLIMLMEKILLMGSRFLTPDRLAGVFQEAGAQVIAVHDDGFSAQVVLTK